MSFRRNEIMIDIHELSGVAPAWWSEGYYPERTDNLTKVRNKSYCHGHGDYGRADRAYYPLEQVLDELLKFDKYHSLSHLVDDLEAWFPDDSGASFYDKALATWITLIKEDKNERKRIQSSRGFKRQSVRAITQLP